RGRRESGGVGAPVIAVVQRSEAAAGIGVDDSEVEGGGAAGRSVPILEGARSRIVGVMDLDRPVAQTYGLARQHSDEPLPLVPDGDFVARRVARQSVIGEAREGLFVIGGGAVIKGLVDITHAHSDRLSAGQLSAVGIDSVPSK